MKATGDRTAGSSAGTQANTREFPREGCEPAIDICTKAVGLILSPPAGPWIRAVPHTQEGNAAPARPPGETPSPSEPLRPHAKRGFLKRAIKSPASLPGPARFISAASPAKAPWLIRLRARP